MESGYDMGCWSAALDLELEFLGEPANAGPAFGLHFVDVFHAGEVGGGIGSSSFGSFLADGVGSSEVIDAGNLGWLGALLGSGEEGKEGEEGNNNKGSHL